jgi:hypothetical protein
VSPRQPGSPPPCEHRRWRVMRSSRGSRMLPGLSRGCDRRQRRDDGGCRTIGHSCGDRRRNWRPRSQARTRSGRPSRQARSADSTASAREQRHRPTDSQSDCADRAWQVGHVALLWAQSSSCSQLPFLILDSAAFHTITFRHHFVTTRRRLPRGLGLAHMWLSAGCGQYCSDFWPGAGRPGCGCVRRPPRSVSFCNTTATNVPASVGR